MLAEAGKLDRRELTRALLADRGEMVCIAGLGAPAWDITSVGDHPLNLPLWGGMGGAAMIGLSLFANARRCDASGSFSSFSRITSLSSAYPH